MKMKTLLAGITWIFGSLALAAPAVTQTGALGNPEAPQGGSFYMNLGGEPTTLNPISSTDLYSTHVQMLVIDRLMVRNSETYEWEPALAESLKVSKDGKEFTYEIRKGATFHDGKPVTSEDIKFSFDAIFDDKFNAAHLRPYYSQIKECQILGPHKVKFVTRSKYFGNLNVVNGLEIVPKHIYGTKKGHKVNKSLVGSGPYQIDKYQQGKRIVLKKYKKWWGNKVPSYAGKYKFDRMVLRFVSEDNIALEMLKKGDLDYEGMSPEVYVKKAVGAPFGKSVLKKRVENLAPKSFGFVGWNFKNDLFKDRNVRVALAHLMNRQLMNEKFRYGMSLPATGPWYQQSIYADPKVKPLKYDPKKALSLLRKSGWSDSDKNGVLDKTINGKKREFNFSLVTASKDSEKYFTLYKEDLRKVGINMGVRIVEWNTLVGLLDDKKFDAIAMAWGGGSVDNDPKQIWHSESAAKGGSNFISYNNSKVDKLIEEARATLEKDKRIPLMRKVYREIAKDAPYAFMFNDKFVLYGHNKRIGMVKPTMEYEVGRDFWWVKAK